MTENSMDSESSSKFNERSRGKLESLMRAFNKLNWNNQKEMTKDEMIFFLNNNTMNNEEFDSLLADKLFQVLDVESSNKITVEEFIKGYLQFDSDLQKNNEGFNNKLLSEQNNLNNLEEQCRNYKDEKLNSEGFCENAKITIEITKIDIRSETDDEAYKNIIEINYNDQTKQYTFDSGQDINKIFEFTSTSRNDHCEFVLKYANERDEVNEMGKKVFPLNKIITQEEYTVQIMIPKIDNEEAEAALINAKITLHWSDFKYFDDKRKKSEQKIRKIEEAITKTNKYLKEINDIYQKNIKLENQKLEVEWNDEIIRPKIEENKASLIDIDNNMNNMGGNEGGLRQGPEDNFLYPNDRNGEGAGNKNKAMKLSQTLGLLIAGLGLIGGCGKPDIPNQLCGIFLYFGCISAVRNISEKLNNIFKYILIFLLVLIPFDLIWLISHFGSLNKDKYTGGHENGVLRISMFTTFISIVVKSFASFIIYKLYKSTKQTINQSNNFTSGINFP